MTDLTPIEAELLEAVLDPRIPPSRCPRRPSSGRPGQLLHPGRAALHDRTCVIERGQTVTTQGEILAAFATHADEELEDVTVVEREADRLTLQWRREVAHFELRAGLAGCAALAARDEPRTLLGPRPRERRIHRDVRG